MECPVMSSSGYRLRSAVSACAQPTPPSLNSPYLSTIAQYPSHHSGGCLKKFQGLERSGESFLLDKIKNTKKANILNDNFCKRHKLLNKNSLNHSTNSKTQLKTKLLKEKEAEHHKWGKNFCWVDAKQFFKGSDFLTKLELTKNPLNPEILCNFLKNFINESESKEKGKVFCDKNSSVNRKCTENDAVQKCQTSNDCIFVKDRENGSNNGGQNKFCKIKKNSNAEDCGCKKIIERNVDDLCLQGNINVVCNESERCVDCWNRSVQFNGSRNDRQEILNWQPKHVMTRRPIQIVRKTKYFFENRGGFSKLGLYKKFLLNGFQLLPLYLKVSEMLKCAREYPKKPSRSSLLAAIFAPNTPNRKKDNCKGQISSPLKVPRENDEGSRRKFPKDMNKYEVFLGGSCNPTTWRSKLAIPELENMKITYFNPQQIEQWRPELMEAEYEAKTNATVIFFVIDNQTRGVSALIEASHLAGNHRNLIVVFQSCIEKGQIICGEQISEEEYEDLKAGQEVLQILMKRQGIPVFDDIKEALKCTQSVVKDNFSVQDLQRGTFNRGNSLSPKEIFESLNSEISGKIDVRDACIALKLLMKSQNISLKAIESLIRKSEKNLNGSRLDDIRIDFDSFIKLMDDFEKSKKEDIISPIKPEIVNDVYLGGTIEYKENNWRETIAIPKLRSQNLSYFIPKTFNENRQLTDIESAAIESSSVLLFIITRTARSVAAMAIAGHYIGRGAKVVLCIQHMTNDTEIGSEKLSECALKDYNRGRMYLTDIAKRNGVEVFDDISEAVELVIKMCKNR